MHDRLFDFQSADRLHAQPPPSRCGTDARIPYVPFLMIRPEEVVWLMPQLVRVRPSERWALSTQLGEPVMAEVFDSDM